MSTNNDSRVLVGERVTITKRGKKGLYQADFHYAGQHRRKSLKTANQKLARQRAVQLESQLADGSVFDHLAAKRVRQAPVRLTQAVGDFLRFHETEGRRRKTIVKYRGILNNFLEYAACENTTTLAQVNLSLVDKYRAYRRPVLSEKSMHHEGSLLKGFFAWCLERNLMSANPLASRKFVPPAAKSRGGPNWQEIEAILAAASDLRRPIIATAAMAGVRIGEIVRLQVEDVDFENNWLQIVSRPGLETKSGQSWKVPLHPRLRQILLECCPKKTKGWFFTAQSSSKYPAGDHHINPKHINEDVVTLLKTLKLPAGRDGGFTFHSLRSSFKTICIHAGVPREVVDTWQNHAPDRAASHVYYKLSDNESQRFMRQVSFVREGISDSLVRDNPREGGF